jgi:hypothetical protein
VPTLAAQGFAEQEFDLPVEAAEIVVSPAADCIEDLRVYA